MRLYLPETKGMSGTYHIKKLDRKNLSKIAVVGFLLSICILATYYCHFILGTEIIFTHLFYIPLILASLWWLRRGIFVAVFLALLLLVSHIVSPLESSIGANFVRALMFVVVGTVVTILNKKRLILEERVAQRTKELTQANIHLQEADRLKSVFLASMSHELRTPLNSIIGFTGIILQGMTGQITGEQKKQLTMVKNSANHLLNLINDLLDISKIEAGKIELAIEEFDLSALVREVKDSLKVAVEEKDLKMSLKMPKRLIIRSDERRTKQVLMNLVSNAVKFTDKGKIEIKVAKKDKEVEVSVKDTGMGIRKEEMDRLFKSFTQISNQGRPKQEGTGLGLYLSKKIVDILGGKIKAESEFGQESVFTFTLPLKYQGTKR